MGKPCADPRKLPLKLNGQKIIKTYHVVSAGRHTKKNMDSKQFMSTAIFVRLEYAYSDRKDYDEDFTRDDIPKSKVYSPYLKEGNSDNNEYRKVEAELATNKPRITFGERTAMNDNKQVNENDAKCVDRGFADDPCSPKSVLLTRTPTPLQNSKGVGVLFHMEKLR